ncbi:MAG: aspartate 1-decarboxylase [Phycisphaerales bacterium]|nr:aspartate 1-decarboxylase [Phycisphaerales bacterium]
MQDSGKELTILTRLLKAKIHMAVCTQTDLNYHGSITIDSDLLKATGLLPNESVMIADCDNGNRFETYIIPGPAGSGVIGINGAAARLSAVGNRLIIMAFVQCGPEEVQGHVARIIICDKSNRISERLEQHTALR